MKLHKSHRCPKKILPKIKDATKDTKGELYFFNSPNPNTAALAEYTYQKTFISDKLISELTSAGLKIDKLETPKPAKLHVKIQPNSKSKSAKSSSKK